MFAEDYWAHVSPSGIQPWYWFTQAGYQYRYAGENLAKDFDTSGGVMDGWMNSPGHKANVLGANYTDVGFAVLNGTLVGGQTTLVVAHYGSTSAPVAAATPVQATPRPVVKSVATPVPTPVPTPTPSPSVTPTPSASTRPVANITEATPPPRTYSLFQPLSITRTTSWPTLASILILLILLGVYVVTHATVWRKGLKRWRSTHYRAWAGAQIGGLLVIVTLLATSGFGRVG